MAEIINICLRCGSEKGPTTHPVCPKCSKSFRNTIKDHNKRAKKNGYFGRIRTKDWIRVLRENSFSCTVCGRKHTQESPLQLDHIFPLYKGGMNIISNIQPLCKACHEFKDISLPKNYSVFQNEEKVFGFLSNQFIKWLANRRKTSIRLPLAIWFCEEYKNKIVEHRLSSLENVISKCISYNQASQDFIHLSEILTYQPFNNNLL